MAHIGRFRRLCDACFGPQELSCLLSPGFLEPMEAARFLLVKFRGTKPQRSVLQKIGLKGQTIPRDQNRKLWPEIAHLDQQVIIGPGHILAERLASRQVEVNRWTC